MDKKRTLIFAAIILFLVVAGLFSARFIFKPKGNISFEGEDLSSELGKKEYEPPATRERMEKIENLEKQKQEISSSDEASAEKEKSLEEIQKEQDAAKQEISELKKEEAKNYIPADSFVDYSADMPEGSTTQLPNPVSSEAASPLDPNTFVDQSSLFEGYDISEAEDVPDLSSDDEKQVPADSFVDQTNMFPE